MATSRCFPWIVPVLAACGSPDDGAAGGRMAPSDAVPAESESGPAGEGEAMLSPEGAGGAAGDANPEPALDGLPYANVVAVDATGSEGAYSFSVSVESADVDCDQYSDWWEVLSEEGELLYRRILEHSHTDANGTTDADAPGNTFTRSGGPVSSGAERVVIVRAHMNVGGYHGTVRRGSPATGFEVASDVGDDFAPGVESLEPLPTTCLF